MPNHVRLGLGCSKRRTRFDEPLRYYYAARCKENRLILAKDITMLAYVPCLFSKIGGGGRMFPICSPTLGPPPLAGASESQRGIHSVLLSQSRSPKFHPASPRFTRPPTPYFFPPNARHLVHRETPRHFLLGSPTPWGYIFLVRAGPLQLLS
jgi:hypothetical protein